MLSKRITVMLCCCLFLPALALSAPKEKEAQPINCLDCHGELAPEKNAHPAVAMGCASCHTAIDAADIPHKKTNTIAKGLSAEQPDLCYGCHDKSMFDKKVVHAAVGMGCTGCHNPHASKNPKLLTSVIPDLCVTCHDKQASGKHVMAGYGLGDTHPVKGKPEPSKAGRELSCISCHNPHASSKQKLFVNETVSPAGLCLMCHKKISVRTNAP